MVARRGVFWFVALAPVVDSAVPSSHSSQAPRVVFKFGGTTVGTPERFETVVSILQEAASSERVVAIVSALSQVSRQLSGAMEDFATRSDGTAVVDDLIDTLRARHMDQAETVLSVARQDDYAALLEERLQALRRCFAEVDRSGFTPAARDAGLSAPHCQATRLVVTDGTFGEANVQRSATAEHVRDWYQDLAQDAVPVVAGFIGSTEGGATTTLGFEGSDYSASFFARILEAGCLTRYTDVDGLYSEDPSVHDDAERLECLSMEEAFAMTESGDLGMHPKTLRPLASADIPMQVRSILEPERSGTRILPDGVSAQALWPVP